MISASAHFVGAGLAAASHARPAVLETLHRRRVVDLDRNALADTVGARIRVVDAVGAHALRVPDHACSSSAAVSFFGSPPLGRNLRQASIAALSPGDVHGGDRGRGSPGRLRGRRR
jgi:hypothetical protein